MSKSITLAAGQLTKSPDTQNHRRVARVDR